MVVEIKGVQLRIGIDYATEQVIVEFDQDLRWIGLKEEDAVTFVEAILNKIDLLRKNHDAESKKSGESSEVGSDGDWTAKIGD
jgi:hypothetical protein